jgi:hypothetical protein
MFIVIAIRYIDFGPWSGSYFVGTRETLQEAIELAEEEKKLRGGYKYGCVVYQNIPDATEVYRTQIGSKA